MLMTIKEENGNMTKGNQRECLKVKNIPIIKAQQANLKRVQTEPKKELMNSNKELRKLSRLQLREQVCEKYYIYNILEYQQENREGMGKRQEAILEC